MNKKIQPVTNIYELVLTYGINKKYSPKFIIDTFQYICNCYNDTLDQTMLLLNF